MRISILVCPTRGCGNFFGHSGMGDLTHSFTSVKVEDRAALRKATGSSWRHTRAECPDCRERGLGRIMREPVEVEIEIPQASTEAPALPA